MATKIQTEANSEDVVRTKLSVHHAFELNACLRKNTLTVFNKFKTDATSSTTDSEINKKAHGMTRMRSLHKTASEMTLHTIPIQLMATIT